MLEKEEEDILFRQSPSLPHMHYINIQNGPPLLLFSSFHRRPSLDPSLFLDFEIQTCSCREKASKQEEEGDEED